MKKRWITGITILTMALGLTACSETAKTTETTESVHTDMMRMEERYTAAGQQ